MCGDPMAKRVLSYESVKPVWLEKHRKEERNKQTRDTEAGRHLESREWDWTHTRARKPNSPVSDCSKNGLFCGDLLWHFQRPLFMSLYYVPLEWNPSYMIECERTFVQSIGLIRSKLSIKYMNCSVITNLHSWYNVSLAVSFLVFYILLKFYIL